MTPIRAILPSILPGTIVATAYLLLLGYRRDYLGHYAAGFGGTLTALSLAVASIAPEHFQRRSPLVICVVVVCCILAGAFAEATLYNIAKFDEVDFCNQSLGAVLAGIGFQRLSEKPPKQGISPEFFQRKRVFSDSLLVVLSILARIARRYQALRG